MKVIPLPDPPSSRLRPLWQDLRMSSRIERYLAHLDRLAGDAEQRFKVIESTKPDLQAVTVIIYEGLPGPGHVTGLRTGVSGIGDDVVPRRRHPPAHGVGIDPTGPRAR
jgi:hypothetical protein